MFPPYSPAGSSPTEAREQIYRATTPRERERWHALWLLSRGWSAARVAQALERDPHTIVEWLSAFAQDGPQRWPSSQAVARPSSTQTSKPR